MPRLPFGDIGPCEVHWGYGYQSGNMPQIITPYLGKVTIRIADAVTDIHEEGKGIAPIDSFFEGTTVELEVPMTRSTLIQLAQTIGWQKMGSLSGSGYVLRLDNIAGYDMYINAETMVIKPLCNNVPDPDPHHWIKLYKCHPYRDIELGFDRSGQRIHLVKFKVFPNRDSGYEGAGGGGQYLEEGVPGEGEDFEVISSNKYLDYKEIANGGTERTATMTEGFYSGTTLAAEIELKMDLVAVAYTWQVSYSAVTHKFTITNANSWVFELHWRTGPHGSVNLDDHIGTLIGFNDATDDTGANTYISDNEVP
ncbi:MAG TPA: hypothetical protein ENH62_12490 [Marinobacter sp.]|uniref:Uncharacterized protein n=1 Tax=marine sediment metagenome TaxID=412755 RepID=A0A0F9J218_9ZZZZ|nr:hypothetical protein [Marinobacter sp.]